MERKINDFSFRVATVNGTGSQSANNILFKSLFRMGVGVCGKNLFPSNIQGLPTWFQIRVSEKGYQCLREHDDIAVLMNAETAKEDIAMMRSNTTVLYNSNVIQVTADQIKPGMTIHAIPIEELAKTINPELRHLLKNLFYVAALSHLYGIENNVVASVIADTFKGKQKAIDANMVAFNLGLDYAKKNFEKKDPYWVRRGTLNQGKIVIEGNTAAALGAIYGGCTFLAWYPITPSSSLAESMESFFAKLRKDQNGKGNYASIQAEDELASIGMVIGASWAGARSMTSTSGPGISLMGEFIGLAYYSEVPAVIWDIQRVGPSTGLPTRTQQGDIQKAALSSHGDTKHIVLFPSTPNDCFEMAQMAFDLSERFQTPVFVLSDLDLGMNIWMDDELKHTEKKFDRGKVLSAQDLKKVATFGRYQDVDGDGICYRTLPGTDHPKASFFTRGSGHDEFARYSESPVVYSRNVDRLLKKFNTAKKYVPKPIQMGDPKSKIGVIACGTSHAAMQETLDRMTEIKYLRIRAYPFSREVEEFIESCDQVFVVEQNRDGQLQQLIESDIRGCQSKMNGIRYYGGFPLSADFVEREIREKLRK